jgi:hypothetical protein
MTVKVFKQYKMYGTLSELRIQEYEFRMRPVGYCYPQNMHRRR